MRPSQPALVVALLAVACAAPSRAAVVLHSAELTSGSGFWTNGVGLPPPHSRPTTYDPPVPFPNDSANYARVGPGGLEVLVNRVAALSSDRTGNMWGDWWGAQKFSVVFELDEPAPFTLSRTLGNDFDFWATLTLQADGQPPIPNIPSPRGPPLSGVLPAGRYTFSGLIDFGQHLPALFPLQRGGFHDVRLTVAPEPGGLGLLAAGALVALRRRTRRAAQAR